MSKGKHARMSLEAARLTGVPGSSWHPCYVEYFRLFNNGQYYEAHDILEHVWLGSPDPQYTFYKALIQVAGGFVHLKLHFLAPAHRVHSRRLRPAARLFDRSAVLLRDFPPVHDGLPIDAVRHLARQTAARLRASHFTVNPWHPRHLPRLELTEPPR